MSEKKPVGKKTKSMSAKSKTVKKNSRVTTKTKVAKKSSKTLTVQQEKVKQSVRKLRVLVSNDDGVYAPGINALAKVLGETAEVHVVAPDRNRSGASHSLTLGRPLRLRKLENGFYSVEGTPSDCVHLALTGLYDQLPDIVVSGINEGANLGDDVLYSGTVAAAMEGRFLGYPSIAVSLVGEHCKHYETAAIIVQHMVEYLQESPLPPATILNVNVPDVHYKDIQGFEVTKLGTRHSAEPTIQMHDPRGKPIYWIGPPGKIDNASQGTDFNAIAHNRVSITPLHADLTKHESLQPLAFWASKLKV